MLNFNKLYHKINEQKEYLMKEYDRELSLVEDSIGNFREWIWEMPGEQFK